MPTHTRARSPGDVLVIGDGLIALSIADALATRGVASHVLGERLPGAASSAAAGLLAPSLGEASAAVRACLMAARDMYPDYVTRLEHETGQPISLDRSGILEVALDERELAAITASPSGATPLTSAELATLEPAMSHAAGAVLHEHDGSVDNRALLVALDEHLARSAFVRRSSCLVRSVELGPPAAVITAVGDRFEADVLILAAGAWSSGVSGLPRSLPVTPLAGQMLAIAGGAVHHAVMGAGGYLVPRHDRALIGSTLEPGRYDAQPASAVIEELRGRLRRLCPSIGDAPERARWAGVRPATPDMLPIIGRDPEEPALVYACGHGKNGILLAPITGRWVADVVEGKVLPPEVGSFAPGRFRKEDARTSVRTG